MKKVFILAVLLSGSSVFAQHQNALNHFNKTYPLADDVFWDEYEDYYEASFILNDKEVYSRYDLKGQWLETATSLSEEDLPKNIKTLLANETSFDNISSIALIEKASEGTTYEINVDTESESFTLVYSQEGSFVKKIDNQEEF